MKRIESPADGTCVESSAEVFSKWDEGEDDCNSAVDDPEGKNLFPFGHRVYASFLISFSSFLSVIFLFLNISSLF